ncbi:uncharacterized protein CC84DRAFT_1175129 [Paraphaeosphaeria sporulosa]|uniref:Uncharacterized protein n=1 Tax=Paraphaeosphaeria sporulosa TaxID=1460663 RepID=A0A177CID8_9PLEO|nr:uncharacterized protein CC84DRAFT_1175129 [Paraphaeosphaeria sporulosa]OAG07284.1 hypothetical protein CC84DRAFT_1175129 [Paraphaeosphaeria sporulosa]
MCSWDTRESESVLGALDESQYNGRRDTDLPRLEVHDYSWDWGASVSVLVKCHDVNVELPGQAGWPSLDYSRSIRYRMHRVLKLFTVVHRFPGLGSVELQGAVDSPVIWHSTYKSVLPKASEFESHQAYLFEAYLAVYAHTSRVTTPTLFFQTIESDHCSSSRRSRLPNRADQQKLRPPGQKHGIHGALERNTSLRFDHVSRQASRSVNPAGPPRSVNRIR